MTKRLAWITGASSGIGRAVAIEMFRRGYQLVLSGRNMSRLSEVAQLTEAEIIPFDISDKQANLDAAEKINAKFGYVDIVFLNAGDCEYVDIKHFDSRIVERMIKTNFLSMVYGVEAVLPLLRRSQFPHLVGMSSATAYIGLPQAEGYGASKAAIRNFLQSLRIDLIPENIFVSIVSPGFIQTPLTDKNTFSMPQRVSSDYAAKKIVDGIESKKYEINVPWQFTFTLYLLSLLPSRWATALISNRTGVK